MNYKILCSKADGTQENVEVEATTQPQAHRRAKEQARGKVVSTVIVLPLALAGGKRTY